MSPSKRVLDVGNCPPDFYAIERMLQSQFDVQVDQAHTAEEALNQVRNQPYALVLVNRKLDIDYSDGLQVIHAIKRDPQLRALPVMLISNYEEYQDEAVRAGATRGFGKLSLNTAETRKALAQILESAAAVEEGKNP